MRQRLPHSLCSRLPCLVTSRAVWQEAPGGRTRPATTRPASWRGIDTTSEAAQQVCADLLSRDARRASAGPDLSRACPHAIAGGASLLGMATGHAGAAAATVACHAHAALAPCALARVIPPNTSPARVATGARLLPLMLHDSEVANARDRSGVSRRFRRYAESRVRVRWSASGAHEVEVLNTVWRYTFRESIRLICTKICTKFSTLYYKVIAPTALTTYTFHHICR